jgi:hypothetical protein
MLGHQVARHGGRATLGCPDHPSDVGDVPAYVQLVDATTEPLDRPDERPSITRKAPLRASYRETSSPRPPFAPVTTATLPDWSGMSSVVQAMIDAMSRSGDGSASSLPSPV